jgi:hypothetical protein
MKTILYSLLILTASLSIAAVTTDSDVTGIGSGGVTTPASSADNAFVRWDGTTGAILQDSTGATLSDAGAPSFTMPLTIAVTGNNTVDALDFNNESDVNPKILFNTSSGSPSGAEGIMFYRDSSHIASITDAGMFKGSKLGLTSGMVIDGAGIAITGVTTDAQLLWNTASASINAFQVKVGSAVDAYLSLFSVLVENAANMGIMIKAAAAQSADLLQFRSSSDTPIAKVTAVGVIVPMATVTADPCADTTKYPEAGIWYNDTNNFHCTCIGGADFKLDGTTACF